MATRFSCSFHLLGAPSDLLTPESCCTRVISCLLQSTYNFVCFTEAVTAQNALQRPNGLSRFSFSYLIRLTYNSHAIPMLLFSFHPHASCTPHSIHLCTVHDYVLLFFSSILPPPCGCIMLFFHFMAMLDACC